MESGLHKQLVSKQKRPANVALFLNKIPLDDRHAAMNMLLVLGLRAYKRMVATAPADINVLRSVVEIEVTHDGAAQRVMGSLKENAVKGAVKSTSLSNDTSELSMRSLFMENVNCKKTDEDCSQENGGYVILATSAEKEQTAISENDETVTANGKKDDCDDIIRTPVLDEHCGGVSLCKSPNCKTPAMCFIMNHALKDKSEGCFKEAQSFLPHLGIFFS